jgi:hypothetical protein
MKIERSSSTRGDAKIAPRGLWRLVCSLFLVAAAVTLAKVDAVGAITSPRANQGRAGVGNALPAATIAVTNTNDSGPGSLRNALAVANDGDTIDATGVSGTVLLTSGELQITRNVTINGPGAGSLAVNGNGTFRAFKIETSEAIISGFTITNGLAADGNGGGGILNLGGLTLSDSVVSNCSALSGNNPYGGAISTFAVGYGTRLTVSNCTISGNSAEVGGAIESVVLSFDNDASSVVTVSNSTLSNNSATCCGGAIYNSATGAHSIASLSIANSTFSGNSATGNGGGIYNNGEMARLVLGGTILNAGSSGENIFNNGGGTVTSLGYNLASDNGGGFLTGPGDQINTNPMLGPLQNNGGPTFTHALLPGSPAIDAGDPNFTPPPFYDQRGPGFARMANGRIDKGAFEAQLPMAQSAFSRKTHGAAGTFDVPLTLGGNVGIECRSGGATNDYQMIINFATSVMVQSASVTSGTGSVSSFSVGGPQVTVNLTGVTNVQRITVTLFGVNDGTHMGNVPVSMGVLIGDVNGNEEVNASDVIMTKAQVGQVVSGLNFREDVNANGTINVADVAIVKSDVGTSLPP